MLAARPALAAFDAHTAAATASVEALRRLLSEDPGRASAAGGPRNWPPLLYHLLLAGDRAASRRRRHRRRPVAARQRGRPERALHVGRHLPVHRPYGSDGRRGGRCRQPAAACACPGPGHAAARRRANPNDAQGLYNTMFRPDNGWLQLLLDRGLTAAARINWKPTTG